MACVVGLRVPITTDSCRADVLVSMATRPRPAGDGRISIRTGTAERRIERRWTLTRNDGAIVTILKEYNAAPAVPVRQRLVQCSR